MMRSAGQPRHVRQLSHRAYRQRYADAHDLYPRRSFERLTAALGDRRVVVLNALARRARAPWPAWSPRVGQVPRSGTWTMPRYETLPRLIPLGSSAMTAFWSSTRFSEYPTSSLPSSTRSTLILGLASSCSPDPLGCSPCSRFRTCCRDDPRRSNCGHYRRARSTEPQTGSSMPSSNSARTSWPNHPLCTGPTMSSARSPAAIRRRCDA